MTGVSSIVQWGLPAAGGLCLLYRRMRNFKINASSSAAFLVVGDLGRSPRMVNHALAAAGTIDSSNAQRHVFLVGYADNSIRDEAIRHPGITVVPLRRPKISERMSLRRSRLPLLGFAVVIAVKIFELSIAIAAALWGIPDLKFVCIQIPPGLPAVPVARFVALLKVVMGQPKPHILLDWHNTGWSLMALNRPFATHVTITDDSVIKNIAEQTSPSLPSLLLRAARGIETGIMPWFGDSHITVSKAAQAHIRESYFGRNLPVEVLYDGPLGEPPRRDSPADVCRSLGMLAEDETPGCRPLFAMTATSYSPDEPLDVLLEALRFCDDKLNRLPSPPASPALVVVVTGKGGLREAFELSLASSPPLRLIRVKTGFFPAEEYGSLLRSVDVGVCMHASSSGVDLPMKLVDFHAAGTPALCLSYPTLQREAMPEDPSGFWLFSTAEELSERLFSLVTMGDREAFIAQREEAIAPTLHPWRREWTRVVMPLCWRNT